MLRWSLSSDGDFCWRLGGRAPNTLVLSAVGARIEAPKAPRGVGYGEGVSTSPLEEGSGDGAVTPFQKIFSIFLSSKRRVLVHSGCYFCSWIEWKLAKPLSDMHYFFFWGGGEGTWSISSPLSKYWGNMSPSSLSQTPPPVCPCLSVCLCLAGVKNSEKTALYRNDYYYYYY